MVDKGRVVNRVAGKYQWSHSTAFQPGGGSNISPARNAPNDVAGQGQKVVAGGGVCGSIDGTCTVPHSLRVGQGIQDCGGMRYSPTHGLQTQVYTIQSQ